MNNDFVSNCKSFGVLYDPKNEDCLRCRTEFPDEFEECKRRTLNEKVNKTKRFSIVKLGESLLRDHKVNKEQAISIMTSKCIEFGLSEKVAKQKARDTWYYVVWKLKKKLELTAKKTNGSKNKKN